jgi:LCP family protein required for cell wall assembly
VAALVTALALGYLDRSVAEIPRVRLGASLRNGGSGPAAGGPENYLIAGVDSAAGLAPNDPVRAGRENVAGLRSDTMMLLRIDPRSRTAALLSLPRDLWVKIAGTGDQRKLTEAIETPNPSDGPTRLAQTIRENFQIPIDHYLQLDFAGFKGIVRAIGGVPVYFARPARDTHSGLLVQDAGCTTLDENGALYYVRARYYQEFRNGRWQSDPTSDLGRIRRQQDFIRRIIKRAIAKGVRNPVRLKELLDVGVKSVTLDETLTIRQLSDLGLRFRGFNPDNLKTYTLPTVEGRRRGQDVLDLDQQAAEPILRIFQGVGSTLAPSTVKVKVVNGSGGLDQAAIVTRALAADGFQTDTPSDLVGAPDPQTVVRYGPGRQAAAQLVARYLDVPVRLEPSPFVADVELTTAADFTRVLTRPKPASEVPTTTSTTSTTAPFRGPQPTRHSGSSGATTTTMPGFVPAEPPPGASCG